MKRRTDSVPPLRVRREFAATRELKWARFRIAREVSWIGRHQWFLTPQEIEARPAGTAVIVERVCCAVRSGFRPGSARREAAGRGTVGPRAND